MKKSEFILVELLFASPALLLILFGSIWTAIFGIVYLIALFSEVPKRTWKKLF